MGKRVRSLATGSVGFQKAQIWMRIRLAGVRLAKLLNGTSGKLMRGIDRAVETFQIRSSAIDTIPE
jgi:hypothetical protein